MDLLSRPLAGGACEGPFRDAGIGSRIYKMLIVAVVDIRQTFKACCQCFTYIPFALETRTPRLAPPRHLQDTIVGKQRHDAIEIVRVEGVTQLLQCRSNLHRHPPPVGQLIFCPCVHWRTIAPFSSLDQSGYRDVLMSPALCPIGVGEYEAAPAGAIKPLPLALALRQAIRDGEDRGRVMAEAAMAALHFDVLNLRA